jgi:hypothetical protein
LICDERKDFDSREIEFDFVDEAPAPVFTGFDRSHDGMLGGMKVLGRVAILGRIAAADVAANRAQPEVYPGIAHFYAFRAFVRAGSPYLDLIGMRTCVHWILLKFRQ